ncbi:hypothetical protein MRB53_028763 [Persea americana]|uniref:Uncharacterized protein n=1 Tax=Persea americana TaxID=3435 RepID=A0ACC2KH00_PERAE|nr:hypothetical protein MRB53_028763 [Persea americana]
MHAYCSCKKFEFEGIPYRHALSVMVQLSIRYLPEHYILKWWTKGVTKVNSIDNDGVEIGSYGSDSCMARRHYISGIFTLIFNKGCLSKEGFKILVNAHAELQMKLRNLNLDVPSEASMHPWKGLDSDVIKYQESSHVVTKGRVKRLKSSRTKRHLYRGCDKRGISHDKRNCPMLLNKLVDNDLNRTQDNSYSSSDGSDSEMLG